MLRLQYAKVPGSIPQLLLPLHVSQNNSANRNGRSCLCILKVEKQGHIRKNYDQTFSMKIGVQSIQNNLKVISADYPSRECTPDTVGNVHLPSNVQSSISKTGLVTDTLHSSKNIRKIVKNAKCKMWSNIFFIFIIHYFVITNVLT